MQRMGVAFASGLTPTEVVECVQLAEELGYESAWMTEGHAGDGFSILTACALATKRIHLGTGISSVFVRSAPTIAMAAACVDYFSGGRFLLGLGSSHRVQVEGEHGLGFVQPVQRLRECVEIIRELLREGAVSYQGSVYSIQHFDLWFQPLRREVPIYVAAVFPKMLQIAGEMAQGVLLTWCTVEHARHAAAEVALGASRTGRSPEQVDIAVLLSCFVSQDKEEARDRMRQPIAFYVARFPRYRRLMAQAGFSEELERVRVAWLSGDRDGALHLVPAGLIDSVSLVGAAEACQERISTYREAGVRLPVILPRVAGPSAKQEAMHIIRACAPR
ncbi:MAG: LLM class flavin-dependent oxidoreductase [Chloroflexi bacterium]|nr:LLM class flavin-dependent oxidoreductase [Chloroflexota bacterium]